MAAAGEPEKKLRFELAIAPHSLEYRPRAADERGGERHIEERRPMPPIAVASRWLLYAFLGALAAIVGAKVLSGGINTRGLLRRKGSADDVEASPERVQLLLSTIAMAGTYLDLVFKQTSTGRLPDIPDSWLGALGASHLLYVGTKLWSTRFAKTATARDAVPPSR
jgi:hypothetical protein